MTSTGSVPTILIADSNDITRSAAATLLRTMNLNVLQAIDGGSGIKVIQEHPVDLVIFDSHTHPINGFEIARYIQGTNLNIPLILISDEQYTDQLHYAAELGVRHTLTKPVDPRRLEAMVTKILARTHKSTTKNKMSILVDRTPLTPEQIMDHAIELARRNFAGGFGGPYAAIVADKNGHILGEGVNLATSRFDPIAHAEVMAIRKATAFVNQPHLENCTIYSTSEPTKLAMALIESVGIPHVVFGLSHADMNASNKEKPLPLKPTQTITRLASERVRAFLQEVGVV